MDYKSLPVLEGEMIAAMTSMTPMIEEFGLHLLNPAQRATTYARLESLKTDLSHLLELIKEAEARENYH